MKVNDIKSNILCHQISQQTVLVTPRSVVEEYLALPYHEYFNLRYIFSDK